MAGRLAIGYKGEIMDFVNLKKGNKIIKRSKIDYDSNKKDWENRGYSLVNNQKKIEKKVEKKTAKIIPMRKKKSKK